MSPQQIEERIKARAVRIARVHLTDPAIPREARLTWALRTLNAAAEQIGRLNVEEAR